MSAQGKGFDGFRAGFSLTREIGEPTDTALSAQVQGGARQKNSKGSPPPMSATNKGRIKTGHKTMIYVLSLMRLLSARPFVGQSTHRGSSVHPSTLLRAVRPYRHP